MCSFIDKVKYTFKKTYFYNLKCLDWHYLVLYNDCESFLNNLTFSERMTDFSSLRLRKKI